ncbi:DUF86 domain-containing protein [Bacillus weihaiensis]|uniref:DUF86 domain-containing protein n=1 Tax=Bacillus weihaiensis TaxID=1547283 RepID=A0A1L3MN66_9BACI|nr:DUF86 domain-containing protein [Bacillus weihaiensis]APH03803.1 hypothetical protein A9C19_02970 [Bacillus weihaiensis]
MYFVNREHIETKLSYLESQMTVFEQQEKWTDMLEKIALERICHMAIETVIDVGNSMIDGFIMRDPGSYEDIIDILLDEKVVGEQSANQLKSIVSLRKVLVQDYVGIDHDKLLYTFKRNIVALKAFPASIRTYLENELGPVSAFIPLKD